MKRTMQILAVALTMSAGQIALAADQPTFPQNIDDNPAMSMFKSTYADTSDKNRSAANVYPVSVDDSPGFTMRGTYSERRLGEDRSTAQAKPPAKSGS